MWLHPANTFAGRAIEVIVQSMNKPPGLMVTSRLPPVRDFAPARIYFHLNGEIDRLGWVAGIALTLMVSGVG